MNNSTPSSLSAEDERRFAALQEAAGARGMTVQRERMGGVDGIRFYKEGKPKNFFSLSYLSRTCDAVRFEPS